MENLGYLPDSVIGGESIWIAAANSKQSKSDIILTDYTPAAGYTLAYQFAAPTPISVAAVKNLAETGWTLEVTGAQTLVWSPAAISFVGIVTHTSTTRAFAVDAGTIKVTASPLRVSAWVAVLAAIDAAIIAYAANPNGSISVEGMSISYRSLSDLTELRAYANYMMQKDSSNRIKRIIRSRFVV
jgi:hypothetical protein